MPILQFDTLDYFEKLKGAGASEELAKIQANVLRDFSQSMDERNRQQLATKGDLHDARNDLQKQIQEVRAELKAEIQEVRNELAEVRIDLLKHIEAGNAEYRRLLYAMMKFGLAVAVALCGIMAKGFGWLGF